MARTIPEDVYAEQWKVGELKDEVQRLFGLDLPVEDWAKEEGIADEEIKTRLNDAGRAAVRPAGGAVRAGRLAPGREERADADSSTRAGRSICSISTICARASACAPTARRIR